MEFGERLREARRKHGLSQEELAALLDVSRQAVSRWEMGEGYPETEKLVALAKTLGLSLDALVLGREDPPAPPPTAAGGNSDRIMVHSANLKTAASCYKFACQKVLLPTKKEPKCALIGVDGHSFWGDSQTLLGWYADEESIQREIEEIMEAMARGEFSYVLKYDVKVKERAFGVEMEE